MKNLKNLFGLLVLISAPLFAFQDMENVKIKIIPVNGNVSMLTGSGGNIGILTGEDGIFMVDDQFAALSPKIKTALQSLSDKPVKFLVNSHFHGDHTGGNSNFQEEGALIVAHQNVRKRLKKDDAENSGLPVITFTNQVQLHVNNNDIVVLHVDNAHTDGDALIYFPQSNVLHTGDTFFNGMFPYIDLKSGGSVLGDIAAAKVGLSIINKDTKIIPGHGALATYSDYQEYLNMLEGIRDNVQKAIDANLSKEQIIEDGNLTKSFYTDEEVKDSFINGKKIRETFYESLTQ